MRLIIAEKPSVAQAIAAELGSARKLPGQIDCGDTTLTWCFGHMLEQAEPEAYLVGDASEGPVGDGAWRQEDLPIVPERWKLVVKPEAKKQLSGIGRLLRGADHVVHAGDPDREGQLLVDEVLEHFDYRGPVSRFWVSAQDPASIRRGLDDLKDNTAYRGMRDAARARQRADWLVGMNLSRAYTLKARRGGSRVLLTVGRVQTPTLSLVVARDRAVEAFVPRPFHVVTAELAHEAGTFWATYAPGDDAPGLDDEGRLVDSRIADALIASITGSPATIHSVETKKTIKSPPRAFSLADLTVLASARFGYGAEETLAACQRLYEVHKLVSYPRTDCGFLPESQHADGPEIVAAVAQRAADLAELAAKADPALKSPTFDDRKVSAHHGIVPTTVRETGLALTETETRLYGLIARRYLAQFFPDHVYLRTSVTAHITDHAFEATGKVVTTIGWKAALPDRKGAPGEGELGDQDLPSMTRGDHAVCRRGVRRDAKTKPPARFTEGSLVRAMEQVHRFVEDPKQKKLLREGDGIGTSATRATILAELKRRKFLRQKSKHLISTGLGRALVDAVPPAVKSPALTALYERMLADVEAGTKPLDGFVAHQEQFVRREVAKAAGGALTIETGPGEGRRRRKTRPSNRKRRPDEPKGATP